MLLKTILTKARVTLELYIFQLLKKKEINDLQKSSLTHYDHRLIMTRLIQSSGFYC